MNFILKLPGVSRRIDKEEKLARLICIASESKEEIRGMQRYNARDTRQQKLWISLERKIGIRDTSHLIWWIHDMRENLLCDCPNGRVYFDK